MSGSQKLIDEALKATTIPPKEGDFVWDEKDEDDRPLTAAEMREGMINKGGRPKIPNPKIATSIRFDQHILDYFKSTGKGWQTRINEVLGEYVASH